MSRSKLKYHVFSHADTDGAIASALFADFIEMEFGAHWNVEITPVNHGPSAELEWVFREIPWPAAILDFSLHPSFLDDRFFLRRAWAEEALGSAARVPPCYWIDHHPTGASYGFLNAQNLDHIMPKVVSLWDTTAISTPGLLRTHRRTLGIPDDLIRRYEAFIDLAEVVDGALFASAEAAHDFTSDAVKLLSLVSPSHPAVDKKALYGLIVACVRRHPEPEALFDADPLFSALIEFERSHYVRQFKVYSQVTQVRGKVTVSDFFEDPRFEGMGRFLPYVLYPDAEYAIHILPKNRGVATISCGINPWNKPQKTAAKHLGNYFSAHFAGGGHEFVAGGKIHENELHKVDRLIEFIQGP